MLEPWTHKKSHKTLLWVLHCFAHFCEGVFIGIIVPFQVRHKLNYFLICPFFWILIVSYDKKIKNFMQPTTKVWSQNLSK